MDIGDFVQQMLILLIFLAVGVLAYKTRIVDDEGNKVLTKLVLNICQPAIILSSAINSSLDLGIGDVGLLLLYSTVMHGLLIGLSFLVSPLFTRDLRVRNTYRFMVIFGNTGFMGIPLTSALFGAGAALITSIYNIPFNILAYSIGIMLLSGGENGKPNWKLLISPVMAATLLSLLLLFFRVRLPNVVASAVTSIGDMTVPASMIVIGVSLGQIPLKSIFGDRHIYYLCLVRLIAAPLLVSLVCRFLITDPEYYGILVVLSSMPAAAFSMILSLEYGGDCETASRGVFLTTVLSVVTAPLMSYWLTM